MLFWAIVPVLCETGGPGTKKSIYTQEIMETIRGRATSRKIEGGGPLEIREWLRLLLTE